MATKNDGIEEAEISKMEEGVATNKGNGDCWSSASVVSIAQKVCHKIIIIMEYALENLELTVFGCKIFS